MLSRLRERAQGESGFTLIELLVVMLIIGLLAAIAIPAFFNQTNKAKDTQSKTYAKTASTALETYRTDHNGSYDSATVTQAQLEAIEPTLSNVAAADFDVNTPTASGDTTSNSYDVSVHNPTTDETYHVIRHGDGTIQFTCAPVNANGCPQSGNWGS